MYFVNSRFFQDINIYLIFDIIILISHYFYYFSIFASDILRGKVNKGKKWSYKFGQRGPNPIDH